MQHSSQLRNPAQTGNPSRAPWPAWSVARPAALCVSLCVSLGVAVVGPNCAAQTQSKGGQYQSTQNQRTQQQRAQQQRAQQQRASANRAAPAQSVPAQTRQTPPAAGPATGSAPQTAAPAVGKPTATKQVTAAPQPSSGKFTLRHRLKAGETFRTRTVHVANTLTRIQGTEDVSESKTISDKAWAVKEVSPEGLMTFEYRIDAVEMSQKQGDRDEITYDSRTDQEAPSIFSRVADTIAKPIAEVTIDASGAVIERDKQSKAPPLGMGELAVPLPKEPVEIGAQWDIPREVRVKLENGTQKVIKLREQYTLEKVSAGVATIGVQSQPLTPVEDSSVEAQLMQQMSQGVIKFDIDNGRLISKQLDWDDEIVGFRGAETSLKYVARFTEEALDSPDRAASAAAGSSRK